MSNGTVTEYALPQIVYGNATAPEDYDVSAGLDRFAAWLQSRKTPGRRHSDSVTLDEIELYAEVLSAVAASDGPLTKEEIDHVLGVEPYGEATA